MAGPDPVHYATPIRDLIAGAPFPTAFITGAGGLIDAVLDRVYYTDAAPSITETTFGAQIDLVVLDEIALQLPGVDGLQIVLGGDPSGFTRVSAGFQVSARGLMTTLSNVTAALRFPREILKPVTESGAPAPGFAQIEVRGSFLLDEQFDLHVEGFDALRLPPSMIGDSGIIIQADAVKLDLSRTSSLPEVIEAGFDESFVGVYIGQARVQLPEGLPNLAPDDLVLQACAIGSGGVSGRLTAEYDDPTFDPATSTYVGRGAGDFFDVPFAVKRAAIAVKQNALTESAIDGQLLVPFFGKRVNVALSLNLDGGFTAQITGAPELGDAYDEAIGLITLEKSGVVKIVVQSLRFEVLDGVLWTKLSGEITPLFGDLEWPTLQVTELAIDSKGNVAVDGGWLNLPEHPSFSFHGFQMEVTKFGLGSSEDGGRWLGLSGGVRLVDEITAGASVEGLRLTWYPNGDTRVSFEGVGIEFTVPKVLQFSAEVAFKEAEAPDTGGRFSGATKLRLLALNLEIDGSLIFGRHQHGTYMALYLSTELPAGIPLWATGLALYGFAGLFGKDVEPDRRPEEEWYDGWYKRPTEGVTDLTTKWRPAARGIALGAGTTIGTLADNGYAFSARVLFAIVFPGPIILIEGRANLFKERAALSGQEPLFRMLTVIDLRENTLTIGLGAQYKWDEQEGKLIDISGSAEAFYDRHDASAWHVYLGEDEPRTMRLRARVFRLFTAESYFMLDPRAFRMGLWAGIDEKWTFGPFRLEVAAWLEAGASISIKPRQYTGTLWLHGSIGVGIWRFGIDLEVDTHLEAEVFTPYHILGELKVRINLPWPLSDISETVDLEWGPEPTLPPLPLPLQSVSVEHFKVTTSWPLERGALLVPNYGLDGIRTDPDIPPSTAALTAPPAGAPVVPLDCRPRLTFGRPVNDDALVAINPQPLQPEFEQIGNPEEGHGPMRVRFGLREVALDAWQNGAWRTVARKVGPGHPSPNPAGMPPLFGSWAPIAQQPGGSDPGLVPANTKLWLWSKTPFDFIRHGGGDYAEWFVDEHPGYPCPTPPPDREYCADFDRFPLVTEVDSPWQHPSPPRITISWLSGTPQMLVELDDPVDGFLQALQILPILSTDTIVVIGTNTVTITFPMPAKAVRLTVIAGSGVAVIARQEDDTTLGPLIGGLPDSMHLSFTGNRIVALEMVSRAAIRLVRICFVVGASREDLEDLEVITQHLQEAMAHWSEHGSILQPHMQYRLTCVTTIEAEPAGELASFPPIAHEQTEYAYFRTEGPPGIAALSVPTGVTEPTTFTTGLDTLAPYVRGTLPDSVPGSRESPNSPVRPVYRAYDIGVFFNEDYVSLMYRAAGRDLGLYLFDQNNERVHEFDRLLLPAIQSWGQSIVDLDSAEATWEEVVDASTCVEIQAQPPGDDTLHGAAAGRVLAPDATYEVRLIPLLFREEFGRFAVGDQASGSGGTLGDWRIADAGTQQGPSLWRIEETTGGRHVAQLSNIHGGTISGVDPDKPGTILLRGDDAWSDYHLQVRAESLDDDAIGVVFRYHDAGTFYRFSMDRERAYRRLVRVVSGVHTILAEDDFRYETGRAYAIAIEAVEDRLRVRQNGVTIFDVVDATIDRGAIGLYCWANQAARFHSIVVEALSASAPVPYRYPFTTSLYANFVHQVHSYQDQVGRLSTSDPLTTTFDPLTAIGDDEAREYDRLAAELGGEPTSRALDVEVVTSADDEVRALWLRGPEPLRWNRLAMQLEATTRRDRLPTAPDALKITGFTPGQLTPNSERLEILCRETLDPTGYAIDASSWPGPLQRADGRAPLLIDEFDSTPAGVVFVERWGPNSLDKYRIVDEGTQLGPSVWTVAGDAIQQTSPIFGGSITGSDPAKPGTVALLDRAFGNVRIHAAMRFESPGAIGLVFRRSAANRYYRLSFDPDLGYRRLIKHGAQGVTVLWEDNGLVATSQDLQVVAELFEDWLLVHLDGGLLCAVRDDELRTGGVGLYAWRCQTATFTELQIETLASTPIAWIKGFLKLGELRIVDPEDAIDEPSDWEVLPSGSLIQHSNLHDEDPLFRGTMALLPDRTIADGEIGLSLSSASDGAMGLLFRYQDEQNYYRFSMRAGVPSRRVTRVVNGVSVDLWQNTAGFDVGRRYQLTLRLSGAKMIGHLDGAPLFSVTDATFADGQIGLYAWANAGVLFEQLVALREERHSSRWTLVDAGEVSSPSAWKAEHGVFQQTSEIFSAAQPEALGTHAIAGDAAWSDYRLTTSVRSDVAGAIGLVFRYVDEDNYYRVSINAAQPYRRLVKRVEGVTTVLWEDGAATPVGRSMQVVVDAIGDRLTVYLDAERIATVEDGSHPVGRIGLYASRNPRARFERVSVTSPPASARALFRDAFDRDSLAGLTVADTGSTATPSNWQASAGVVTQTSNIHDLPVDRDTLPKRGTKLVVDGQDWSDVAIGCRMQSFGGGAIGLSFRYQDADNGYRFSMDSDRAYRRLIKFVNGNATLLWESADGYVIGQPYTLVVVARGDEIRIYLDDIPLCVLADADLTHGSVALYCWHDEDARFSGPRVSGIDSLFTGWALDERFEMAIAGRWTFTTSDGVDRWQITDGGLSHDATGSGLDFALTPRPAIDHRISARVLRSGAGAASVVGVVTGFIDRDNYLAFVVDSTHTRLIRRLAGAETELASTTIVTPDREIILTLTCDGGRITGHLDGEPMFDIDASPPEGRIGVACAGNLTAVVKEVVVSRPTWRRHFTVASHGLLPAGTLIDLRSGSRSGPDAEAGPTVAGAVKLYAAEAPDPGDVQFGDRVQLRLVSPLADTGHHRSFLPASAFQPLDATVIRKRDATSCFIVPASSAADPANIAKYQLRLTFRRDNRPQEPDSLVLRQAGDANDEVATLLIPIPPALAAAGRHHDRGRDCSAACESAGHEDIDPGHLAHRLP